MRGLMVFLTQVFLIYSRLLYLATVILNLSHTQQTGFPVVQHALGFVQIVQTWLPISSPKFLAVAMTA